MKKIVFYCSLIISFFIMVLIRADFLLKTNVIIDFFSWTCLKIFGDKFYSQRSDFDPAELRIVQKLIIALPGLGCTHYFKRGGCSMCAFNREIEKYHFHWLHPLAIFVLVKVLLNYLAKQIKEKKISPDVLIIFMAGSFINEEELPACAQRQVLDFFLSFKFSKLVIESRPEFILDNRLILEKFQKATTGRRLEVCLGLEAADDYIRNRIIKKGLSKAVYEKAVQCLADLGVIVNTYVLLGAPNISRKEAVNQSVATAVYAWSVGSGVVSLETYCVQAGTKWAEFYKQGDLKLFSLWDIIKVIEEIDKVSPNWYLGEFSDWPTPIAVPTVRCQCRGKVINALETLRQTHRVYGLDWITTCQCKTKEGIYEKH